MSEYIGSTVNINNEEWRVGQKTFKYGREWQYTLSHEKVDGTYKSMNLNENALERIIESTGKDLNSSSLEEMDKIDKMS